MPNGMTERVFQFFEEKMEMFIIFLENDGALSGSA